MNDLILTPYFQPILSMSGKNIQGLEVLARGVAPDGTVLGPNSLFGNAGPEDVKRIDRTIRERAFARFSELNLPHLLFINLLPDHFLGIHDPDNDSHVFRSCNRYGIDPKRVVLEITETATDRFPEVASILKRYSDLGFSIAIDDWGAEYSNFDRLTTLMPSIVKFDARFLWRATTDPSIAEIFCAAVTMVMKLGITVIAEGIERIEHLYLALDAGCPFAQGFLLGRPDARVPHPEAFTDLLEDGFSNYREGKIRHLINQKQHATRYVETMVSELSPGPGLSHTRSRDDLNHQVTGILMRHPEIIRAYILDRTGIQVSPNLSKPDLDVVRDNAMIGRDWSWRPYYIEMMVNRRLFDSHYTITGPYVDPRSGIRIYTVCIVVDPFMVCVDFRDKTS